VTNGTNSFWWGARRTRYGDLVTLPAVWGTFEGIRRVGKRLEWVFLTDGGTRLIVVRVGPGKDEFDVVGLK
jgi:hypothetical protein